MAPHIYSEQEITDLMTAARGLGPTPGSGLRGVTFETLFGLISSTVLRVSEAVHLKDCDVDLQSGMLTEFAKSRHVPKHSSTVQVMKRYRSLRSCQIELSEQIFPAGDDNAGWKGDLRHSQTNVGAGLGIIKSVMGLRQFSLRGLRKVTGKWALVCLALNVKGMAVLRLNQGQTANLYAYPDWQILKSCVRQAANVRTEQNHLLRVDLLHEDAHPMVDSVLI